VRHARFFAVFLLIGTVVACGKKGPPLAPFQRVPAQVGAVTAQRIGDDVYVSFTVPETNVDGQKPADIGTVEVYAVTATHPPETEEQREMATLVATVPVRPILPEGAVAADGTPLPLPPGVDRGAVAVVQEALTPETSIAVELPPKKDAIVAAPKVETERPVQILVAPAPIEMPRRYYFAVAISPRGRIAVPSNPISIPLEPATSAPGAPEVTYTESEMTITWQAPPDARTATIEPPPPVIAKPVVPPPAAAVGAPPSLPATPGATAGPPSLPATLGATAGQAQAGNVTPAKPVAPPLLVAKSLGFTSVATTYHVYEVPLTPAPDALSELKIPADAAPGSSPELKVPPAMTPAPLAVTTVTLKGVVFGKERCFFVRPVDTVFGAVVQGPASPITCVTPRDTFAPAAPKQLAAIGSAGIINLIWEPNSEPDLAGYIVLRGDAPGDKLQALTPAPISATNYRDTDVKPGVRYVYAVVAVDKAEPPNVSGQSNRAEETARQ
jgi:predicted small lipoprotein YifL